MDRFRDQVVVRPKQKRGKNKNRKPNPHTSQTTTGPKDCFCPICLQDVAKNDIASIPSCKHTYCVYCIVQWAEEKLEPTCPQCKKKFDSLRLYRKLDGSVSPVMSEESICLIKRAHWFKTHKARIPMIEHFDPGRGEEEDWDDDYYEENEIDDFEDFYFSNAAGSARIVVSNRKFGKNGYVRSGRVFAQTTSSDSRAKKLSDEGTEGGEKETKERNKTNPKGQRARRREDKKKKDENRIV